MKALLVAINDKGGVCCTYVVIDVKVVMDMVSYSAITYRRSAWKDRRMKGSKDQWHKKYGTKYSAQTEEVVKG
jgi:hypothetical protein